MLMMSKACIIRALRSDPHHHLMHWTLGAIVVYHILAMYIRHSHAKLNLLANMDVAYLMRAGSLVCMRIYPTLFFVSSFFLYFALSADFVHYQWAPKCHGEAKLHIQLFTGKIIHSSCFAATRAFSEVAMAAHFLRISIQESRWDTAVVALLHVWFFGVAAYAASAGHRCMWAIVRCITRLDRPDGSQANGSVRDRIRAVCAQFRFESLSLCQC
jgi:hypothetical protein